MDSRVDSPARAAQDSSYFRYRHRDRENDHALQHVHHLLRDERVDRQTSLRQSREEKGSDEHAKGMVSADQRYGDAEKSGPTRKPVLVIMLVTQDIIDSADSSDHS